MATIRQWLPTGLMAAIVAVLWAVPLVGVPARVQIRWAEGMTDADKRAAAIELGFRDADVRGDGVWVVNVSGTSSAHIRKLVSDARVADTHNIDRRAFRLERGAIVTVPRWAAQQLSAVVPQYRDHVERAVRRTKTPLAMLLVILAAAFGRSVWRGRTVALARGIPELSPYALATFRILLGAALIAAVVSEPIGALPLELQRQVDWMARLPFVRGIAASSPAVAGVHGVLIAVLVSFAMGLLPRASLALAAVLLTLSSAVRTTHASIHDWGLPTITLWIMLLAPWQEGFGLSQMWRRWRGDRAPVAVTPRGLAVWIPGLTIGVAFLAAAYAKLDSSGLAWVTGGAVRYHFIEDAGNAPVTWGLSLVRSDWAAVVFSMLAIGVEATVWLVIWFRQWAIRLLFGMAVFALLLGFHLFQGVFWEAWWTLLLAFVPWSPLVDRLVARLPRFIVLADGECPLCRRSARLLHTLDWFDRVTFADASSDDERQRVAPGLAREAALQEMHVIRQATPPRWLSGYDGYLQLSKSVPLLWAFLLIGGLPPVAAVGRSIYRRVAGSRLRRGRCTTAVCQPDDLPLPSIPVGTGVSRRLSRVAIAVIACFVLQQVVVSTLRIESEPLVSDFGMYSYSWPSRDVFDEYLRNKTSRYTFETTTLGVEELDRRLRELPKAIDVLDTAIDRTVADATWTDEERAAVSTIADAYRARYGEPLGPLRIIRVERRFDWELGAFDPRPRLTTVGIFDPYAGVLNSAGR